MILTANLLQLPATDQNTGKTIKYTSMVALSKECKAAYESVRWYFRDCLRWGAWRVSGQLYITEGMAKSFLEAQENGEVLKDAELNNYSYRHTQSKTAFESEMEVKDAVHIVKHTTAELVDYALRGES